MPHRHRHRQHLHQQHWPSFGSRHAIASLRAGVPPAHLIRQDFENLKATTLLRTSAQVEELLLMQSIEGHAHEGHGAFRGRRFLNLTMEDTVRALGLDPQQVAATRQQLIDEVASWLRAALEGKAPDRLVDEQGYPLLDVSSLRFLRVEPREVLRGFYLGGLRDNSEVRLEVEARRKVVIGGGQCYLVDVKVMEGQGLDGEQLAHGEYAADIARFRELGMIRDEDGKPQDPDRVRYMYIRHRRGTGTSDDAALVACGLLWGLSAALGAFLADAVDTLEKYVPIYSDQDDDLARMVAEDLPEVASEEELYRLTYLCALPEDGPPMPDSSLRHMLMVNRAVDQTALEGHLSFIQGLPYAPMPIAFEQVSNAEFYEYIRERVRKEGGCRSAGSR